MKQVVQKEKKMHQARKYECGKAGRRELLGGKRKELKLLTLICLSIINFRFEMLNVQLCLPSSKEKAGCLELIQVKSLILKPEVA